MIRSSCCTVAAGWHQHGGQEWWRFCLGGYIVASDTWWAVELPPRHRGEANSLEDAMARVERVAEILCAARDAVEKLKRADVPVACAPEARKEDNR
jgi:hypothetical protein